MPPGEQLVSPSFLTQFLWSKLPLAHIFCPFWRQVRLHKTVTSPIYGIVLISHWENAGSCNGAIAGNTWNLHASGVLPIVVIVCCVRSNHHQHDRWHSTQSLWLSFSMKDCKLFAYEPWLVPFIHCICDPYQESILLYLLQFEWWALHCPEEYIM